VIQVLDFGDVGESESDRVERFLGDQVICSQCGATLGTYADQCSAALDVPCLGFLLIEGLRLHLRRAA
jgi:hypothetical protein